MTAATCEGAENLLSKEHRVTMLIWFCGEQNANLLKVGSVNANLAHPRDDVHSVVR